MMDSIIRRWEDSADSRVVHVEEIPGRGAIQIDLDPPVHPALGERLEDLGVERLYRHQARAISSVRNGSNTVVVAGTASGM